MTKRSNFSMIFVPETWHRPYSDLVNLIDSIDSRAQLLIDHKMRGEVTSIHDGKGINWRLSSKLGIGTMLHTMLNDTVLLQAFNFKLKSPISIRVHKDSYIAFSVVLEGVDNISEQVAIGDRSSNFCIISTLHEGDRFSMHFPSAKWIQTVSIMLPVSQLTTVLDIDLSYVQNELALGFESWKNGKSHYTVFDANVHSIKCASEILTVNYQEPLHQEYIKYACRELLCHFMASWDNSISTKESPYRYSIADREALDFAKQIVATDFRSPPSISSLATQIGLSENKLTYGFRYFYGQSVHNFAVDLRMTNAMKLLTQTRHSVEEIAIMVGYKRSSGFIKAFKARFGITPLKVRNM